MRWLKQRNEYSCGPIVMLNILKWAGYKVSYKKDYKYWKEKLKCDRTYGTNTFRYMEAVSKIPNIKMYTCRGNLTFRQIKKALSNGALVLLNSAYSFNVGDPAGTHVLLVSKKTKKSLFLVNSHRGHSWFTKNEFKKYYMQKNRVIMNYPNAYFIIKDE